MDRIEPKAHFIWLGPSVPYVHVLAARSAAQRGGFDEVVFHHDCPLQGQNAEQLQAIPGVTLRLLDSDALFDSVPTLGSALRKLFARLSQPAARANMLRAAILYSEGGVYLDTDTVTVGDLDALRSCGAFYGTEPVCFPGSVRQRRRPVPLAKAYLLSALRELCRLAPRGVTTFRRLERLYALAANNAVLGAKRAHPLSEALLAGMVALPEPEQLVRYALGTHLLQRVASEFDSNDVVGCAPGVFYPLGPVMSRAWFDEPKPVSLGEALLPETRVVHWYASVRTKRIVARIDAEYVRAHAHRQLFSELALPFVA